MEYLLQRKMKVTSALLQFKFMCTLILLIVINMSLFGMDKLYAQNTGNTTSKDFLKSFPLWGGKFDDDLNHCTNWIIDNEDVLKTLSWHSKKVETRVYLKDTKFFDYDEERDTSFTYRGKTISPKNSLDLVTRSFTYSKRVLFLDLNEIHSNSNRCFTKTLFKIDNAEFIRIHNIKIFKAPNDKEYLFIYLQSGETGIKTGIYCYELDALLNNYKSGNDNTLESEVFIPLSINLYENFSITHHQKNPKQIILTATDKSAVNSYTINNYFIDFNTKTYIKKQIFSHHNIITTPKIIQNDKYRVLYFKKRIEKNRFFLSIGLMNESYDEITEEITDGYYLFNTSAGRRYSFVEKDIGFQAVWQDTERLLLTASIVSIIGSELRGVGTEIKLLRMDFEDKTLDKKTLVKNRQSYYYFNSDLHYDKEKDLIQILWVAETDANKNGYPDSDAFLTYGSFPDDSFNTVNLSLTPRPVWSPQLVKDSEGWTHFIWLQEHPDKGYQCYHRSDKPNQLATFIEGLNLPLYGDNKETIFTLVFYYIISIGGGIFEGTILNGIALLFIFLLIILVYRFVPRIGATTHTVLLCLFALIITLIYGVEPFSFPIHIPTLDVYIAGFFVGIFFLILLDRVFYKKTTHTAIESCIKLWFFSLMFSIYVNYAYMSTFIGNEMIVTL